MTEAKLTATVLWEFKVALETQNRKYLEALGPQQVDEMMMDRFRELSVELDGYDEMGEEEFDDILAEAHEEAVEALDEFAVSNGWDTAEDWSCRVFGLAPDGSTPWFRFAAAVERAREDPEAVPPEFGWRYADQVLLPTGWNDA